jgi:hypothetical protein
MVVLRSLGGLGKLFNDHPLMLPASTKAIAITLHPRGHSGEMVLAPKAARELVLDARMRAITNGRTCPWTSTSLACFGLPNSIVIVLWADQGMRDLMQNGVEEFRGRTVVHVVLADGDRLGLVTATATGMASVVELDLPVLQAVLVHFTAKELHGVH